MRIISWNVNGIRAVHKKGLFLPFIAEYNPDIIVLQETKAEQGECPIDLTEYKEFWNSSKRKKGYSGTAIFTKIAPEEVFYDFPTDIAHKYKLDQDDYGDVNAEGRVIAAKFKDQSNGMAGFYLVNSYTPNSKPDLSRLSLRHTQWDPAFLEYVQMLEKDKPVIFTGDLNVAHTEDDLANPQANRGEHGFTNEERKGIDAVIKAGFVDTFRLFTEGNGHYTWWSHFANARARNVGWRIDYFFVSKTLVPRVKSSTILPQVIGSDHCPIFLELI